MNHQPLTRLAPSPTGALHLGNARTFLVNWALAKQNGWRILLRIDDLDSPRTKINADQQAIDILQWLGMDWDDGPVYQMNHLSPYHDALEQLNEQGLIYPCRCSRKEIKLAQSAPHDDDSDSHDMRYPGTCRSQELELNNKGFGSIKEMLTNDQSAAWRVRVPDEAIVFDDVFHGQCRTNVQQQVGDFIVASKAGLPAYQLAVVVDDDAAGVTHIVRGDDLIRSTPRQLLLYQMLGFKNLPTYTHLPLVLGFDGLRLAKRHGDTRLTTYREQGIQAERLIGLLAKWCGLGDLREMSAGEFADLFQLDHMPRHAVSLTETDEHWLRED